MNDQKYLRESAILNFSHKAIQSLIHTRGWLNLNEFKRIGAAYDFVRNEIKFGYNYSDNLLASEVLQDGYGQCNTKGNLLMALLRALDIPCRFHGFTIDNQLQKGAIPNYIFWLAPKYILHSWVEVRYEGKWLDLEGFILDDTYLNSIKARHNNSQASFKGYGIATPCLQKPKVEWLGESTYIQKDGIHDDFGLFETPDAFYKAYGTNLNGLKRILYQKVFRHLMNSNLKRIRKETRS